MSPHTPAGLACCAPSGTPWSQHWGRSTPSAGLLPAAPEVLACCWLSFQHPKLMSPAAYTHATSSRNCDKLARRRFAFLPDSVIQAHDHGIGYTHCSHELYLMSERAHGVFPTNPTIHADGQAHLHQTTEGGLQTSSLNMPPRVSPTDERLKNIASTQAAGKACILHLVRQLMLCVCSKLGTHLQMLKGQPCGADQHPGC